jgi:hypothetical protein
MRRIERDLGIHIGPRTLALGALGAAIGYLALLVILAIGERS